MTGDRLQRLRRWWGDAPHADARVDLTLARAYILDTRDTPFVAALTAAAFWISFAVLTRQAGVFVWAVMVHAMQWHMYRHLHGVDPDTFQTADAARWRRHLEWRMLLPGLVWAAAPWLFFPRGDLALILLQYFFISGVASVSIAALAQWWLATLCFGVPLYLSIAVRLMTAGEGGPAVLMGVLALSQLLATLHYARKQNLLIVGAIESGLENARLAEALQTELDRVAHLAAQRARIFAAANHDLRQPMHALAVFIDALEAGRPAAPSSVRHMQGSIEALRGSVDALLDIAQLDRGAMAVHLAPVDLGELFESLQGRFAATAATKGLRLFARPTRARVLADAQMLSRLLANLVDNALKYTERGCVLMAARPCTQDGTAGWRIEVRDSGIGIAPALREQVFEEFFQVDNPGRDRSRGLGLGLALVASMARTLGTRIALRSASGQGSTFSLWLAAAMPQLPVRAPEALPPCAPARILVLDDEAPVREGMRALLGGWGHEVQVAATPGEALALPGRFDLLLSDLRLGEGLSGLAAARTLHGLGKVREVSVVTGETAQADRAQVEAAGFQLLYKPVPSTQLRLAIARAMGPCRETGGAAAGPSVPDVPDHVRTSA